MESLGNPFPLADISKTWPLPVVILSEKIKTFFPYRPKSEKKDNPAESPQQDAKYAERGSSTTSNAERQIPLRDKVQSVENAATPTLQTAAPMVVCKKWTYVKESFKMTGGAKSGWKAAFFIIACEAAERAGSFGLQLNLVVYLITKMNLPLVEAVNTTTNFLGATCMATVGGAYLADAYWGRFRTIIAGSLFYLVGLLVLTLSAALPRLKPTDCTILQRYTGQCQMPDSLQMGVLYLSLVLQGFGSGGVRPCVAPFGADQFDKLSNKKHDEELRHYFNWYYMFVCGAMFLSVTVIVYVQDSIGWGWGLGLCAALMAVGIACFLLGAPTYKYLPPSGSPVTTILQVLVAALRKYKHTLPENPDHLYEARKYQDKESLQGIEQELLTHTDNFRFLDKAAILEDVDEEPDVTRRLHKWRLVTVHQVEELKILLRMLPVWLCTIIVSTIVVQSGTFAIQQAMTLDLRMGSFQIPPASLIAIAFMTVMVFIPIYDLVVIKLLQNLTGHPKGLTYLQRIGIGIFLNVLAMVAAALVEEKRRKVAYSSGMVDPPPGSFLPMSLFWMVPQFVLTGFADSFVIIGMLEFFYDEGPLSMRSMSNAFLWTSIGMGSFLSTLIVTVVQKITQIHGRQGWLQSNINLGHIDYFYWFLAALAFLDCIVFLYVSHWYVYKNTNLYDYHSSADDEVKETPVGKGESEQV